MSNSTDAHINPEFLRWARAEAGVTIEEAADKMEFTVKSLRSWEEGHDFPTIDELFIISEIYGLPVSMFYLSELPKPALLKRDNKARKAFNYLKSQEFTPEDYFNECKEEKDDNY